MLAVIVFEVGAVRFAIERSAAARILPVPRLVVPPAAPRALCGFFALGADLVAALRLHVLLGVARDDDPALYDHLLLLKAEGPAAAFLVDRVTDVVAADAAERRAAPPGVSHRDCVLGEIAAPGGGALLIDPVRIIAAYEQERLRHFHAEERRRRDSFGDAA